MSDDGRYKFYINEIDGTPDFVVVIGKGLRRETEFNVPKSRTLLATYEPYNICEYSKGYCSQFGIVLACQPEMKVSNPRESILYRTPAILPWFVGALFNKDGSRTVTMNREDIFDAIPQKTKLISVITSKKAFTKGHLDRQRFVNRLMEKYGDEIDVFGRGYNDFGDKWDVLAPYKYHIVIENTECDYYWTEKLSDCYLTGTYPLYHGCTNVNKYFSKEAYTPINIKDFKSVVDVIERAKESDLYEKSMGALLEAKQLVLTKYNMFNLIAKALDDVIDIEEPGKILLKPCSAYFSWHNLYLHMVKWPYYNFVSKRID
jgi:hypothetical protein